MKMLFSRWNSSPPSIGWRSALPAILLAEPRTISRRQRRSPRYSLFTLSKIKNLASSAHAQSKTLLHPIVRLNDASRRSCRAAPAVAPELVEGCNRDSRTVQERTPACLHQAALAVACATAAAARDHARSAWRVGGGERNRTDDLLLAKQALSQLSYTPMRLGPVGFGARSAALRISGGPGRI